MQYLPLHTCKLASTIKLWSTKVLKSWNTLATPTMTNRTFIPIINAQIVGPQSAIFVPEIVAQPLANAWVPAKKKSTEIHANSVINPVGIVLAQTPLIACTAIETVQYLAFTSTRSLGIAAADLTCFIIQRQAHVIYATPPAKIALERITPNAWLVQLICFTFQILPAFRTALMF